jgi:exodeoxyribonuclease VII large subunit
MWSTAARKAGFVPDRGQQVVATGRLDYYGPQGKLQLYVDALEPVGQGVLEMKYRQLCEELRNLGYFDESRKRPMPAFPMHIAVVTSANGAALHDVIRTARQRWPGIALSLYDVRVQGAAAAPEIAAAVDALGRDHERLAIDAIILTRGGGSLEDLWAFNERLVADAVFKCPVPIAAAIGHETDTTIAELVADLRCSTPTQAAARLVPDARAERQRVEQCTSRLSSSLRRNVQHARTRLDALAQHPIFRRPDDRLASRRVELDHLQRQLRSVALARIAGWREQLAGYRHAVGRIEPGGCLRLAAHKLAEASGQLTTTMNRRVKTQRGRIEELSRVLQAIGPQNVLRRGFSYTTDASGRLVTAAKGVTPGQVITTHLSDGKFESQVVGEKADRPVPEPPTATPDPKPRRKKPAPAPGGGLFG